MQPISCFALAETWQRSAWLAGDQKPATRLTRIRWVELVRLLQPDRSPPTQMSLRGSIQCVNRSICLYHHRLWWLTEKASELRFTFE